MSKSKKPSPQPQRHKTSTVAHVKSNIFSNLFIDRLISSKNDSLYQKIFWGISAVVLIVTIGLSQISGINGDDKMQNEYEQKLMKYYATMGQDTGALNLPKTKMQYYGGVFEVLSGVNNRILGNNGPDQPGYHKVRHVWTAIFGVAAMIFAGLFAESIAGWFAGILALIFIFLTPSFLGHSLMNPKDIPFATGFIMSLYFTYKLLLQLPNVKRSTYIGLSIALGISLGVRAGGLINFAILAFFMGLHYLSNYGFGGLFTNGKALGKYLKSFLIPAIIGYIIALAFWPYAIQSPIKNVFKSLSELTDYGVNIRLLFNGDMVFAQSLPLDYLPRWVLVTVPLFILLGWSLFIIDIKGIFQKYNPLGLLLVAFGFLFPFIYVIYKGSTVYDGWRHMLFPYTAGVVFAALPYGFLWDKYYENKMIRYGIIGVLAVLAFSPAGFIARNPAYPYVYFNPIVGGVQGANGRWENDYWGVSVKQGVEMLENKGILKPGMKDTVTIASNFYYALEKYIRPKYGKNVKLVYVKYRQRYDQSWDYALFINRFIDASYIQKGTFPPKNTIGSINADGIPLLVILQDKSHQAFLGGIALKKQNWTEAVIDYEKAISEDPKNEAALSGLANAYLALNQLDKVKSTLDKCIAIDPDNTSAWNFMGMYYLNLKDLDNSAKSFKKAIDVASNNSIGYYYLGIIEQQKGHLQLAIDQVVKSLEVNQQFAPGYQLLAQLYQQAGEPEKANQILQMMPKGAK